MKIGWLKKKSLTGAPTVAAAVRYSKQTRGCLVCVAGILAVTVTGPS